MKSCSFIGRKENLVKNNFRIQEKKLGTQAEKIKIPWVSRKVFRRIIELIIRIN